MNNKTDSTGVVWSILLLCSRELDLYEGTNKLCPCILQVPTDSYAYMQYGAIDSYAYVQYGAIDSCPNFISCPEK